MSILEHISLSTKELAQFEQFLHTSIPLTQAKQLKVVDFNGQNIRISAPLQPNINDKGTVFGGSSASLMIIAGWSLVHLNLQQLKLDNDIVIIKNQCQWNRPLSETIYVKAEFDKHEVLKNAPTWAKRGKKISVNAQITNQKNQLCCSMLATYAVIK